MPVLNFVVDKDIEPAYKDFVTAAREMARVVTTRIWEA